MKKLGRIMAVLCVSLMIQTSAYAGDLAGKTVYLDNQLIPTTTGSVISFQQYDLKTVEELGNGYCTYTNYPIGYSFQYPEHMELDLTNGNVCTVLTDDDTRISIYYQPLLDIDFATYIGYSNRFLEDTETYFQQKSTEVLIDGYTAQVLQWQRKPLPLENDFPYYMSVDIQRSETEAISIHLQSRQEITADELYTSVFSTFSMQPIATTYKELKEMKETAEETELRLSRLNDETREFLEDYFSEEADLTWGIYEKDAPYDMDTLYNLERQLQHRFKCLIDYYDLFEEDDPVSNVIEGLEIAYQNQRIIELTLQTTKVEQLYEVLAGKHDAELNEMAASIADFGHPVLIRLANEMNGDWCVYSAYHYGKDTELYKTFYRYIYDIFEVNGANSNCLWVWNPNEKSFPDFTWNDMQMYYPGNEYVDIIGLTGYNTGTYYEGETWRVFDEIYAPIYADYCAMFSQPLMITEFGCSEIGGNKVAWIENMFDRMAMYPEIKMAVWWSGCDWDFSHEEPVPARIYQLSENEDVIEAFRKGLRNMYKVKE